MFDDMEIDDVAAGALGFIHGNVPGAYLGYKAWKKYKSYQKKNMAPVPKSKLTTKGAKRRAPPTKYAGKRKKSLSATSYAGTRRRSSTNSYLFSTGSSVGSALSNGTSAIRVKAVRQKGTAVHKEGRKKRVKVPKLLRKQVNQILKPSDNVGTFMEIHGQRVVLKDLGQSLKQIGYSSKGVRGNMFDPVFVQYAAAVLFRGKSGILDPALVTSDIFNNKVLKVNVLKQHVTFRMKNNTARVMNIKLYIVSPKSILPHTETGDAAIYWIDSMKNEEGATNVDKRNLGLATPNTLYATPYMSKMFMQRYSVDQTTIVLEPGKEYQHTVEGPAKVYDFAKYFQADTGGGGAQDLENNQKFTKSAFITCYYDLAGTGNGDSTRGVNMYAGSETNGYGLLVESTIYMKIVQPDLTGFEYPSTGVLNGLKQDLTFRKVNPYYLKDWSNTGPQAGIQLINDNTPNAPVSGAF